MIRSTLMLIALALAVMVAVAVPSASAQEDPACDSAPTPTPVLPATATTTDSALAEPAELDGANNCETSAAYPGPFANVPGVPSGPYAVPRGIAATPSPQVQVTTPAETPQPGSPLAHSGSETFVLAYLGTGLLAFGAVALGLRRRPFASSTTSE